MLRLLLRSVLDNREVCAIERFFINFYFMLICANTTENNSIVGGF